jgi:hypothetical protein
MFIKNSAIKKYLKERGRRVGKDFIHALDVFIQDKLDQAVKVHNGGKVTVDASIAGYIGLSTKR